eukprot:m.312340 g.312340  ORF g.312340 m.312340 type:complete len:53 (+) comp252934_c0_seq1:223-381(+)
MAWAKIGDRHDFALFLSSRNTLCRLLYGEEGGKFVQTVKNYKPCGFNIEGQV